MPANTCCQALGLFACLLTTIVLSAATVASSSEGRLKIKRPIVGRLSVTGELRIATNYSDISYRHMDAGVQIRPVEGWEFAAHYRIIRRRSNNERWQREKRFYLQVENIISNADSAVFSSVRLKIRNRVESRARQSKDHSYRNRLRFKVKSKNKIWGGVKPFVSNEFYYDLDKHRYNINRIDLGLDLGHMARLKHTLYLKFKSSREDHRWATVTSLVYKLDI